MKSIDEYNKFYETQIVPMIDTVEQQRIEAKKAILRTIILGVIALIVIFTIMYFVIYKDHLLLLIKDFNRDNFSLAILGLIYFPVIIVFSNPVSAIIAIAIAITCFIKNKKYKDSAKINIIEPVVSYLEPKFTYYPVSTLGKYEKSLIINKFLSYIFKIKIQDLFIMKDEEQKYTSFSFIQVKTKLRIFVWIIIALLPFIIDAQPSIYADIIIFVVYNLLKFRGLFFRVSFNKDFSGEMIIVPNTYLNLNKDLKKVNIEDQVFEKHYNVYGSDQIQARYILSTSFIEKLNEFAQKVKIRNGFKIIFKNNSMYMKVPQSKPLFEPKVFKTLYNFESSRQYYYNVNLGLDMVEELRLNNRIWTKI